MKSDIMLTLCIPTNGIVEWVLPVLDSIYSQEIDLNKFEVIVTDNGCNDEFYKQMKMYQSRYSNLNYEKTESAGFMNQVEAFKKSNGEFVKFVNHRAKLLPGSLQTILDFVSENINEKPMIFFSNGELSIDKALNAYSNFDDFVKNMSYYSSWSAGLAFWKEDFFSEDKISYNNLFPHTDILFKERKKTAYYIDNRKIFEEINVDNSKKGTYLLFKAFAVDYISILLELYLSGDIKFSTFDFVKKKTFDFFVDLYIEFKILKKECSYDLSDARRYVNVFYNNTQFNMRIVRRFLRRLRKKLF